MLRIRNISATFVLWVLLLILNALFLAISGIDALEGRNDLQFYADSSTYHKIVSGEHVLFDSRADLVSVAANFLGPWLILNLLSNNYTLVLLFNHILFLIFIVRVSSIFKLDSFRLLLFLIINPITLSSLLSVNKEIISLMALMFLLLYLVRGRWLDLLMAISISLLVRWQLMLFILSIVVIYPLIKSAVHYRVTLFIALLITISLAYMYTSDALSAVRDNFLLAADKHDGSGLWIKLNDIQENGFYFLAFMFKSLHLLFGLSTNLLGVLTPENFYNDVIQVLNSIAFLIMLALNFRAKKVSASNDLFYISLVYLAIFVLSPIYSPRYLYPVYALWVVMYCYNPANIFSSGNGIIKSNH